MAFKVEDFYVQFYLDTVNFLVHEPFAQNFFGCLKIKGIYKYSPQWMISNQHLYLKASISKAMKLHYRLITVSLHKTRCFRYKGTAWYSSCHTGVLCGVFIVSSMLCLSCWLGCQGLCLHHCTDHLTASLKDNSAERTYTIKVKKISSFVLK